MFRKHAATLSRGALATLLTVAGTSTALRADSRPLAVEDYYRLVTVQSPAMSPDGRSVAFIKTILVEGDNTRQGELWIVAADGSAPARRLSDPSLNVSAPRWSLDGRLLAFSGRRRSPAPSDDEGGSVWFLHADHLDERPFHIRGVEGAPIFSPDNKWIAFTRRVSKPKTPPYASDSERLINERFVASRGRAYEWLNYRFDQRGYLPDPRSPDATPPEELFIVARDGGEPQQLTRQGVNVRGASWRADSGALAFIANEYERDEFTYERADLWTVTLDAKAVRLTNDGYTHASPAWSPDGRSVAVRRELGLSAVIAHKQNHGEGWILKPRGYDTARAWPLILTIHGGPHGAYGNDFSFEQQLFAAQGYFVVYTNPRGSTNYGETFHWATWGSWGNSDFDDVIGGVDYAKNHYNIDDKRLGVTGYSYGGFLTNWIIGHTTRFAAAIAGAGVSNWISDYGTSDIPRTKESEFFGPPWDARAHEVLLKQSPIEYVANVRTPTMFVHGESDMRVPIEEGEQMYVALKKLKVPARFVRYPDSYHGGWSPWNTVHRYYEELKWWTRWLGDGRAGVTE